MVSAYLASPRVAELAQSTVRVYTRHLTEFAAALGGHAPAELEAHGVARLRDNLSSTPGKANLMIKTIGALYAWGREMGWVTENPAQGVRLLKTGEHQPWSKEALAAIPTALPDDVAWPCMLALYTGQRVGDVLQMRRDKLDGHSIFVCQQKTGKELSIPLHKAIRDRVLAAPSFLCVRASDGRPWTTDSFRGAWEAALALPAGKLLKDAGVVFHGLRKNATVKLVEAGCSESEIASITGMSLVMVQHYSKGANQRRLAVEAMRKMELST